MQKGTRGVRSGESDSQLAVACLILILLAVFVGIRGGDIRNWLSNAPGPLISAVASGEQTLDSAGLPPSSQGTERR